MTHYHVFLPPPTLTPLPLPPPPSDHLPLHFYTLPLPDRHESLSQSIIRRRQARVAAHLTLAPPIQLSSTHRDDTGNSRSAGDRFFLTTTTGVDGQAGPSRIPTSKTGRRSRSVLLAEANELRGRSRRIRGSASLLLTLPQLDHSDSVLSLNTTTSFPSQNPSGRPDDSVYNLPRWTIPLSKLTTIQALLSTTTTPRQSRTTSAEDKQRATLIVCVLGTEAPKVAQRKDEKKRGGIGTLWVGKWEVLGAPVGAGKGEGEVGLDVRLWEGCARDYGEGVRRGDVVLLENVEFKAATSRNKPELVLSPTPTCTPRPTVLYRTLPRHTTKKNDYLYGPARRPARDRGELDVTPEDRAMRPDLRLGRSDAGVRRVAEHARWFAEWVGGAGPPG